MKNTVLVSLLVLTASNFAHANYKAGVLKTMDGRLASICKSAKDVGNVIDTVTVLNLNETENDLNVSLAIEFKTCVKNSDETVSFQAAPLPLKLTHKAKDSSTGKIVTVTTDLSDYTLVLYDNAFDNGEASVFPLVTKQVGNIVSVNFEKNKLASASKRILIPGFVRAISVVKADGQEMDRGYVTSGEFKLVLGKVGDTFKVFTTK
jgi:hypothetical protein